MSSEFFTIEVYDPQRNTLHYIDYRPEAGQWFTDQFGQDWQIADITDDQSILILPGGDIDNPTSTTLDHIAAYLTPVEVQ